MSAETAGNSNPFIEVAISKMEKQDKRIGEMETFFHGLLENSKEVKQITAAIASLKADIQNTTVSETKILMLNVQMDVLIKRLSSPPKSEVLHHHHVPKLIWATIILFVILCLICTGWFHTNRELDRFIENDTKYRALRLDTASKSLQDYLDQLDSIYAAQPLMRQNVLQKEKEFQINFNRLQRAIRLKEEARALEKAAGK